MALGPLDSDDSDEIIKATMSVDISHTSNIITPKQARVESELAPQIRWELEVDSFLPCGLALSSSPSNCFPFLTKVALDVFSIPATSAECERGFSETKRLISIDRNGLSVKVTGAIQCQKTGWIAVWLCRSSLQQ